MYRSQLRPHARSKSAVISERSVVDLPDLVSCRSFSKFPIYLTSAYVGFLPSYICTVPIVFIRLVQAIQTFLSFKKVHNVVGRTSLVFQIGAQLTAGLVYQLV